MRTDCQGADALMTGKENRVSERLDVLKDPRKRGEAGDKGAGMGAAAVSAFRAVMGVVPLCGGSILFAGSHNAVRANNVIAEAP